MSFAWIVALGFSIMIPGIIALFRWTSVDKGYYPFLLCIWLGCLNELLSFWLVTHHHQSVINNNIYVLLEALLILTWFRNIGIFQKRTTFLSFGILLLLTWLVENLFLHSPAVNSTYFKVLSSFLIVFMSMNGINEIIFSHKRLILKNATFLLCVAFVVFFSYKALIHTFFHLRP